MQLVLRQDRGREGEDLLDLIDVTQAYTFERCRVFIASKATFPHEITFIVRRRVLLEVGIELLEVVRVGFEEETLDERTFEHTLFQLALAKSRVRRCKILLFVVKWFHDIREKSIEKEVFIGK